MKILGNRVLVSKVEDAPKEDGIKTVEVQDSFIYKGKVELTNGDCKGEATPYCEAHCVKTGDVILFARNSPDTQDVEHEGKKMKVVRYEDIIAIL